MTARQFRTERRAAERKARKIAQKTGNPQELPSSPTGQEMASEPGEQPQQSAGFVSQIAPKPGPVLHAFHPSANHRAEINRANAQHSTGPRTPDGKLASSRNSLKHGLASAQLIIPGEDPAAFDALLSALLEEHQPANATEDLLVQEIAQSYWLTQRAIRFQNQCFTPEGVDEKRLALFLRYQVTHDRTFHKALKTLIQLKKDRAIGFVSQSELRSKNASGFVSQAPDSTPATGQFVSQTAGANGFVSQNTHSLK